MCVVMIKKNERIRDKENATPKKDKLVKFMMTTNQIIPSLAD